jgi:spermidine/putrescine transport system permease protein
LATVQGEVAAAPLFATAGRISARRRRLAVALLVGPAVLLIGGALLVPAANLLVQSFLESEGYGQLTYHFTLSNYVDAIRDPVYRTVAWRSFALAAAAAVICVAAAYPVAFFITFRLRRARNLALFLVVVSLFTSYLVRLYAWYTIFGEHGVVNSALTRLGLISDPLLFLLFSRTTVLIAFVNVFLPYAILMIASSMQNVPAELLENARDLGASPLRTFSRVVLPLTMTGAIGAFMYTFILTSGDYITPALLGGTSGSTSLANIVSENFVALGSRPAGAAISFLMLLIYFGMYLALTRLERFKGI